MHIRMDINIPNSTVFGLIFLGNRLRVWQLRSVYWRLQAERCCEDTAMPVRFPSDMRLWISYSRYIVIFQIFYFACFVRHVFHKNCVDPWLLEHRTCPMCKMNILKALGIPVRLDYFPWHIGFCLNIPYVLSYNAVIYHVNSLIQTVMMTSIRTMSCQSRAHPPILWRGPVRSQWARTLWFWIQLSEQQACHTCTTR